MNFQIQLLEPINALVLRNREAGPIGILGIIEERLQNLRTLQPDQASARSPDSIASVLQPGEVAAYMAAYKEAAGFAMAQLNAAPPIIS